MGILLVMLCVMCAVSAQAAVKTNFSVSSAEKLEAAFRYVKKHGVTEFTVTMSEDLYKKMTADDQYRLKRKLMLCGAGYPGRCTLKDDERKVVFSVTWRNDPVYQVTTKKELEKVIKTTSQKEMRRFTLVMGKKLYAAMSKDKFGPYKVMLGRYCVASQNFNDYKALHIISVWDTFVIKGAKYVTTMAEAKEFVRSKAEKGETRIHLFCSASLYGKMREMKRLEDDDPWPDVISRQEALMRANGASWFRTVHADEYRHIGYADIKYYPGYRIVNALEKGREKQLSGDDRRLLETAWKLVKKLDTSKYRSGTVESKKAAAIVEALVRMTTPGIVLVDDSDDCARGPLLYGMANCDGYSDAFYLCASLAGLEARHICSGSHMWNMLRVGGKWYFVDATWCDAGTKADFSYFMFGRDRASRSHVYFEDIIPALAKKTDPKLIP